jgi:hypothetical protein
MQSEPECKLLDSDALFMAVMREQNRRTPKAALAISAACNVHPHDLR